MLMPNPIVETLTVGQTTYDIHDAGAIPDPGGGSAGKMLVHNVSGPAWELIPGSGVYSPVGTIIAYMGTTAPRDYLICDGTAYNIADYPLLANHITTSFGSVNFFGGDGTTTFAVPDLRGEFLRGTGTNSHADQGSGENVGVHQDATGVPHFGLNNDTGDFWSHSDHKTSSTSLEINNPDTTLSDASKRTGSFFHRSGTFTTASGTYLHTTRPTNTSVLYCIAYQDSTEDLSGYTKSQVDTLLAGKQNTLTFDNEPTANSTNSVASGAVYAALQRKANRNLLDNWYFGSVVSVVDQRGGYYVRDGVSYYSDTALETTQPTWVTSGYTPAILVNSAYSKIILNNVTYYVSTDDVVIRYSDSDTAVAYSIDRWRFSSTVASAHSVTISNNGLEIEAPNGSYCAFGQLVNFSEIAPLIGKSVTFSILYGNDLITRTENIDRLPYATSALPTSDEKGYIGISVYASKIMNAYMGAFAGNTFSNIQAAKLELGSEQTLAHKENGVWVLNEIPDYTEELAKCQRYYQIFPSVASIPGGIAPTSSVSIKKEAFRPVMNSDISTSKYGTISIGGETFYYANANL